MRMTLRKGTKGNEVKEVQKILGITSDGDFGKKTEAAVKKWQAENRLTADGIVGPLTWFSMSVGTATTDTKESTYKTTNGLVIHRHMLPKDEYMTGSKPEYVFLHHTAGWNNPFKTIDHWARDTRGTIATEFVLGGQSIKGNDDKYDGVLVQCTPQGGWGWHLGTGNNHMHKNSVGIEVNNFGYIKEGKTYSGAEANISQVVILKKAFRGYTAWHRYSDKQIEVLKQWILFIAERDNIDVRSGLPALIKQKGVEAFDYNEEVVKGKHKGLWTHTNVRKDKSDMFPQPELMDMLVSL